MIFYYYHELSAGFFFPAQDLCQGNTQTSVVEHSSVSEPLGSEPLIYVSPFNKVVHEPGQRVWV